jgi:hypothetical protein
MPYMKQIGHTPKYFPRQISRSYKTLHEAKIISKNIPCTYLGRTITFEDSYEAYVLKLEKMTPWQRFVNSIYS